MGKQKLRPGAKQQGKSSKERGDITTQTDYTAFLTSTGLYITLLTIYIYTTYRSIPGGDSGELLSAACEYGVAHPPGYPLWTMMSIVAIKVLPFNPAFSVNLLTCSVAAAAALILQQTCYKLCGSFTGSLISTILYSLSPIVWTWSITGEVFALNNLFSALLINILVGFESDNLGYWASERRRKIVMRGAFISGLALTNQHTIVLFLPALVVRVAYKLHKLNELSLSLIFTSVLCGLGGLLPYWYMVISSYNNTARWSWGDQTTISGFLTHFLREEYGSFSLGNVDGQAHPGFIQNLVEYKQTLLREFTVPFYSFACMGIVQGFIDSAEPVRRVTQTLVVMLACYVSFFCWRANLDITSPLMREVVERFWMQPNIVWAILISLGYKLVYLRLNLKSYIPSTVVSSLVALVLGLCLARSWSHTNHHDDNVVGDFAQTMISSLPKNSLILTKGDLPSGTLRYKQFCEGVRPDLTLIEQELMTYSWYLPRMRHLHSDVKFPGHRWHNVGGKTKDGLILFTMADFLWANIEKRPIFVCIGMQEKEDSWTSDFILLPYGACHQVVSKFDEWVEYKNPYNDTWSTSYTRYRNGSWEGVADEEMWNAKVNKALFLYNAANQEPKDDIKKQLQTQSYKAYKRVMDRNHPVPDYFHKNFALACERMARNPDQEVQNVENYLRQAIKHFTLYIDSGTDDPQVDAVRNVVNSLQSQL